MDEISDSYFHNIPEVLKTYWLEHIPFIDEREKNIFMLLLIGNNSLRIGYRMGLELDEVLFDRDNLFKKIQLLEGVGIVSSARNCVKKIEEAKIQKETTKYCVYSLTFPDGKIYIGVSCDVNKRWSNGHGYKQNKAMYEAIVECGWDKVDKQILYSDLPYEDARKKERSLILEYKSVEPELGYNRTF